MPIPRARRPAVLAGLACAALLASGGGPTAARAVPADADLERASGGRIIHLGSPSDGGRGAAWLPAELYVARVLAGEAEPDAPAPALEALAIAIRTYALFNLGRHARDGYDVCDTTHCQVPRAATDATRRAALATAGRVLMYQGAPAEVFYSASCGGRTERVADVWPLATWPYLPSIDDDVHGDERPWVVEMPRGELESALRRADFAGSLRGVRIDTRTASGRAAQLRLDGMRPDTIAADRLRGILGGGRVKSTAFEVEERRGTVRFTGRGYGHGVGLCVVGAARRAARGESAETILARYFPGLEIVQIDRLP